MSWQVSRWTVWSKICLATFVLSFSHILEASALLSDDFNPSTSEPNPSWRFYDPYDTSNIKDPGESAHSFDGTNALISIPKGSSHDLWKTNNTNKAPRLLQITPNTDFKFEVKFETSPKIKHQLQGVIIQQSDNIFLRFDVFYNTSGVHLFIAYIDGTTGKVTTHKSVALPKSPNYRQVIRSGDHWTLRYSDNGTTWTDAAKFTQKLTVTEVGFFAGTVGVNPKFLSSVDYFIDLDEPITDTDTWTPPAVENTPPPVINTWYKYGQPTSGQQGLSQKWVNILGNVSTEISLSSFVYTVNGGSEKTLRFGADSRRLQKAGDFNIEIDQTNLNVGLNRIEIKAKDSNDQVTSKVVIVNHNPSHLWPLPYTANWTSLSNIQDIENMAHVVDGLWKLTPNGIRTVETGYDRFISIGDTNWESNYEVTVPITLHSGFSGVGFGVGWQGHEGVRNPKIEWPLQALAWIRGPIQRPTLEIITYGGLPPGLGTWENTVTPDPQHSLALSKNVTYMLKSSSIPIGSGKSQFSVKFWPQNEAEPSTWNVKADVPSRNGSVFLVAYNADVTFGNVSIREEGTSSNPVVSNPPGDTTPPVTSNINVVTTKSTATITWKTNEPSNSQVEYGRSENYGLKGNNSAQATTHSVTLTGLNSNTDYHYQVKSADKKNNTGSSGDLTFKTSAGDISPPPAPGGDLTPPVISNIKAVVTGTTATITWTTDEAADSRVNYGQTSSFGLTANSSTRGKAHTQVLTGLSLGADYHYQVSSTDGNNNTSSSGNRVFTIKPAPGTTPADVIPPVISDIQIAVANTTATISWVTNELSTSSVNYGKTIAYGSDVKGSSTRALKHSAVLTNLTPKTKYHYQIKVLDNSNNSKSSVNMEFTTKTAKDIKPPAISNIQATINGSLAIVTWETDEPSSSIINYGTDEKYGEKVSDLVLTTKHRLSLNLMPNTDYFYQIKSVDSSDNAADLKGVYKSAKVVGVTEEAKECLFNWAEKQYPELFKPELAGTKTELFEEYTYRYYSKNNVYLGFFQNKEVHLLEANKTEEIVNAGEIEPFLKMAECQ